MAKAKKETTGQQIARVVASLSEGESLRSACKTAGIAKTTFLERVDSDQYARARDAGADVEFEEMADLERQCLSGELDPHVFKAAMDSRKWRLSRKRPKVYGDKVTVGGDPEQPLAVNVSGTISALIERAANVGKA